MTRREAGSVPDEQIIAANMDTVFIINALNKDFNVRRIERYLIAVWESGAAPSSATKADLCESPEDYVAQVEAVAPGVPVHAVSSLMDQGKATWGVSGARKTVAITGTSGAGKSTPLNWLSGQEMRGFKEYAKRTQGTAHDDASRALCRREARLWWIRRACGRLWDSEEGFEATFADIATLAQQCRFHDCRHETEAGCAVQEARRTEHWMQSDMRTTRKRSGSWPISPVKRGSAPAARTRPRASRPARATETAKGHISVLYDDE